MNSSFIKIAFNYTHCFMLVALQLSSLQKQHEVLRENFKSLLETAKRELERKDKVISDLTTADHPR